ncbi:hypothetical protein B0H63DRAFT_470713 [Podospora didyma]|uniref:Uncharacterized protein n=1 Tax=Podospora didyma TaxID=330526 RepID=A0AAE0NTY3_9PEZI|nr:hypothetical protein B0H63DRAFT_470713 [Podospora didyma]
MQAAQPSSTCSGLRGGSLWTIYGVLSSILFRLPALAIAFMAPAHRGYLRTPTYSYLLGSCPRLPDRRLLLWSICRQVLFPPPEAYLAKLSDDGHFRLVIVCPRCMCEPQW